MKSTLPSGSHNDKMMNETCFDSYKADFQSSPIGNPTVMVFRKFEKFPQHNSHNTLKNGFN